MTIEKNVYISPQMKSNIETKIRAGIPKSRIIRELVDGGMSNFSAKLLVDDIELKANIDQFETSFKHKWIFLILAWFTFPIVLICGLSWSFFSSTPAIPVILTVILIVVVIPLWIRYLRLKDRSLWWLLLILCIPSLIALQIMGN